MTVSEYHDLKQEVAISVGASERHGQILQTLKEFYVDKIDSARRFEQITKVGQLLSVLEIRDVLSPDDVGPLKEIVHRLPNNRDLLRKIHEYEAAHARGEHHYASEVSQKLSNGNHVEMPLFIHPFGSNLSERKRLRIINTVVEEIGTDWRDLARHLEMRECTIEDIESNNNRVVEKAANLMQIYEERADPQKWFFILCDALERSRRRDLSKLLQNIMAMNI